MSKFSLLQEFELNKTKYLIRKGSEKDLSKATSIINLAYNMWLEKGFKSHDKTIPEVGEFFLPDGYVVEDGNGEVVATSCIRSFTPRFEDESIIIDKPNSINKGKLLNTTFKDGHLFDQSVFFYSLAVSPRLWGKGFGRKLFEIRLQCASQLGFRNSFLETGMETWLVGWYEKMGYRIIAQESVPNSKLHTVIMHKEL